MFAQGDLYTLTLSRLGLTVLAMNTPVIPTFTLLDRMSKARDVAGLSQDELAHRLGLSLSTVRRLEKGITPAKRIDLLGWATACGVDPAWLLKGEGGSSDKGVDILCELTAELVGQLDFFTSPLELCAA